MTESANNPHPFFTSFLWEHLELIFCYLHFLLSYYGMIISCKCQKSHRTYFSQYAKGINARFMNIQDIQNFAENVQKQTHCDGLFQTSFLRTPSKIILIFCGSETGK